MAPSDSDSRRKMGAMNSGTTSAKSADPPTISTPIQSRTESRDSEVSESAGGTRSGV